MKNIILCADDYGYSDGVSEGILQLIQSGKLQATSCMTTMPLWQKHAKRLLEVKDKAQIGLHFNLTDGDGAHSLRSLIIDAHLGRLEKEYVQQRFDEQLRAFRNEMSCDPDFIDGHQHIQHLPMIRDVIVDACKTMKAWVRVSSNGLFKCRSPKELIIHMIGAAPLMKLLDANNIPYNPSFQGIYGFKNADQFPQLMMRFIDRSVEGGLVMCHPGIVPGTFRQIEFDYLLSGKKPPA